ncbi:MAG: DUF6576 domain-containing protein [Haliscomenobacter sp.]|uniref:DUF6576 domain-containing protein n=1 Tax=Haliscomenobacter sp. TaxID=2717303 RepID=UPI0029B2DD91|nr:DUF6576 domain-containing protein [Haliscomenobacter sp.]MDX2066774.1 DUF6576 domain-containing protein [Haliscomenobacter sp.]
MSGFSLTSLMALFVLGVFLFRLFRRNGSKVAPNKNRQYQNSRYYDIDDEYNEKRANERNEVNRLLEKIKQKGMQSLNAQELQNLNQYSQKTRD